MSKNTLEVYVKETRASTAKNTQNPHQQAIENQPFTILRQAQDDRKTVIMELDPDVAEHQHCIDKAACEESERLRRPITRSPANIYTPNNSRSRLLLRL